MKRFAKILNKTNNSQSFGLKISKIKCILSVLDYKKIVLFVIALVTLLYFPIRYFQKSSEAVGGAPTISGLNIIQGSIEGGTEVEISGTNFFYEQSIEIIQTAAGSFHSLAIDSEGNLYAWGYDNYGQIGNGNLSTTIVNRPQKIYNSTTGELGLGTQTDFPVLSIGEGTKITNVYAGEYHSLAIDSKGNLYAWGWDNNGQIGNGDTSTDNVTSPQQIYNSTTGDFGLGNQTDFPSINIDAGTKIVNISAGNGHSVAIDSNSNLYAWGWDYYGAGAQITSISCGTYHSFAIDNNGNLYAWGYDGYGQIGNGNFSANYAISPQQIYNSVTGDFGLGNQTDFPPINIGINTKITNASAGNSHSAAIDSNGNLYAWGFDGFGQIGNGDMSTFNVTSPQQIYNSTTGDFGLGNQTDFPPINIDAGTLITNIKAGSQNTFAVDSNNNFYVWGRDSNGEVGNGNTSTDNVTSPQQIYNSTTGDFGLGTQVNFPPINIGANTRITDISVGNSHSLVVDSNSILYAWGSDTYGQVGNGGLSSATVISPQNIMPYGDIAPTALPAISSVKFGNNEAEFVVNSDELITAITPPNNMGLVDVVIETIDNQTETLVDGFTYMLPAPTIDSIDPNRGPTEGGEEVEITGTNFFYKNNITIIQISLGQLHTLAIDDQGNLYAWGWDQYGQIGYGNNKINNLRGNGPDSPVKINGLDPGAGYTNAITSSTKIVQVAAGGTHSLALDDEGNLYAWGNDATGAIGDGIDTVNHSGDSVMAPKKITGLTAGGAYTNAITSSTKIEKIATGNSHSLAVDDEGNIYAWGSDINGQVGDSADTTNHSGNNVMAPKVISGLSTSGYTNPINNSSSQTPTKIVQVAAKNNHSLARDEQGNIYAWGNDANGQVGDGTNTANHSSNYVLAPKIINGSAPGSGYTNPITSNTNIIYMDAGFSHSLAVDDEGNIYAWGNDSYGEVGDGADTTNHSTNSVLAPKIINGLNPGTGYTNAIDSSTKIIQVAAGQNSIAIDDEGNIYTWGNDSDGQVADGADTVNHSANYVLSPKIINGLNPGTGYTNPITSSTKIIQAAANRYGGSVLDDENNVYTWGNDTTGQGGDGDDIVNQRNGNNNSYIDAPKIINDINPGVGYTNALKPQIVPTISSVSFNALEAASFVVNSDTSITAITPAHAEATVDVTLTTLDNQEAVLVNGYIFEDPFINLAVDNNNVNINLIPNLSNLDGTVSSTKHVVSFTSNIDEVDLLLSTDASHSDLVNLTDDTKTISPLDSIFPLTSQLTSNTWGFGLENRALESSSTTSTTTWSKVPNINEPSVLINSTTAINPSDPVIPTITDVYYGAKINISQVAGYYQTTVIYTAVESI